MTTLINLISGQTIPNLIAHKYIKPQKIILLYSKDSVKQKDNYKKFVSNVSIDEKEIDPFSYDNIKDVTAKLIKANTEDEIVLNFTCGTKIMSLASFEAFKEANYLSIYIDSENSKIYKYKDGVTRAESLNIKITSEEFLKFNGHIYKIDDEKKIDDSRRKYFEYLENNYNPEISKFLNRINDKYEKDHSSFYKNNTTIKNGKYEYTWDNNRNISTIIIDSNSFYIQGKDSIKYITGMWFEDLVYHKKFFGTNCYDEIKRNIHIKNKIGRQDIIELDIIGSYRNNFHLFELKSGKPRRDALNNLRTIKEQLGTYTKLFIISYFDIDVNDTLFERMDDLKIKFYKYSDFQLNKCLTLDNVNL